MWMLCNQACALTGQDQISLKSSEHVNRGGVCGKQNTRIEGVLNYILKCTYIVKIMY